MTDTWPEVIIPDMLHFNEKGCAIWASAMKPTIGKLMSGKK